MIVQSKFRLDTQMLDPFYIESIQCYPTTTYGFTIWETEWSDNKDDEGNFNRYINWGPFAELHKLLENTNCLDNKIAIVYSNGLVLGFYDGKIRIGTKYNNHGGRVITKEEFEKKYDSYIARKKVVKQISSKWSK